MKQNFKIFFFSWMCYLFFYLNSPFSVHATEAIFNAFVQEPLDYNSASLLTIEFYNEDFEASVTQIKADLSNLGGSDKVSISPEIKQLAINVSPEVEPGDYLIPISIERENGQTSSIDAQVTVEPANPKRETDWEDEIIYFVMTDRYFDGDTGNNNPLNLPYQEAKNQGGIYHGGDFKGLIEKLDYLKALGITTLWITPIVQNIGQNVSPAGDLEFYGYHGYWAQDFEVLNPHLGSLKDFHDLIDQAAKRDINIMVDVVLNHAGYGMDQPFDAKTPGSPSKESLAKVDNMFRTQNEAGEIRSSLSGLPDFKTEDSTIRQQIIDWQVRWLELARTPAGNTIDSFRVDTIKHVEPETLQLFKNELVKRDSFFRLMGEHWDASYTSTFNQLGTGKMDALLDFGFKTLAMQFAGGRLEEVSQHLGQRNQLLNNNFMLSQFLSSHDEDGFLYLLSKRQDEITPEALGKYLLAVSLQLTSKGQPVIYYGEEIGQTGENNWPIYNNRYDFNWDQVHDNSILTHYQKLIAFRHKQGKIMTRGDFQVLAGSNEEGWIIIQRSYQGQSAYIAYNTTAQNQTLKLKVDCEMAVLEDEYFAKEYEISANHEEGCSLVVELPKASEGGTLLLVPDEGQIIGVEN